MCLSGSVHPIEAGNGPAPRARAAFAKRIHIAIVELAYVDELIDVIVSQ
jgi:hypothetical protein